MRRFSKTLLSLLTVVLAVTAWGAAQRAQRAEAPRAVGDLTLASADPADGKTVTEIKNITLTFSAAGGLADAEYGVEVGKVVNKTSNTEVAQVVIDGWGPSGTYADVIVTAKPAITEAGDYSVVINSGAFTDFYDSSSSNGEITLNYTIGGGGGDDPVMAEIIGQKPLAAEEVSNLSTIELQFNQAVELGLGTAYWELTNLDTKQIITTGFAALKEGDNTTVVITLAKDVTETGNYCLVAPMDYVYPASDPEAGALLVPTTYYTVKGTADVKETLELNGTSPAQGDYEAEKFHDSASIAINFFGTNNKKVTVAGNSLTLCKDGQPYKELTFNTMMLDFGAIMLPVSAFVDEMESGVYTIDVPAGFFTCGGKSNEALQLRWNFTKKTQGGDVNPDYELVINKLDLKGVDGTVYNLMDPTTVIPGIEKGQEMTISTTDNNTVQYLWVEIYHNEVNSVGTEEKVIDTTLQFVGYDKQLGDLQPINRNEAGEFWLVLNRDSEIYANYDYHISVRASNMDGVHAAGYVDFGTQEFQFKGNTPAFEYSDVDIVSIFPNPDDENFEITSNDFEFIITFSAPVEIVDRLTFQNEGQGAVSDFAKITPNANKTVYTFTPTKSFLEGGNGAFAVGAIDMKGRPVAARGATKIKWNTCMQIIYDNNLDRLEFPVTPAGGTVESIYEFEVETPDDKSLGMTTNNLNRPYLETSTGAFVCYVDIEDTKLYHVDGTEVGDDEMEPFVQKIKFHLEKEITAPGIYYMVFPSGSFICGGEFDSSGNRPARYEFIIEGTPEVAGQTVSEGAALSELGMVGFIFNNEVAFAGRNQNIALRKDGSSYLTAPAFITMQDGRYLVCANFTENEAPVKLEEGAEYELRINNGQLEVPGTDMKFEQISVNFTGVKGAAEYVALTSEVAGHAASVAKVAKGETATVNFTPAEGWKVASVTFNGADVTAQVNGNAYTTPALDADAAVNAVYAYDGNVFEPTGMDEVFGDFQLRAWSENGAMFVAGLQAGMTVDVYTVNGTHVGNYVLESDDTLKINAAAGTYVITVAKDGKREAVKLQNK